jgi:hypothetical protein
MRLEDFSEFFNSVDKLLATLENPTVVKPGRLLAWTNKGLVILVFEPDEFENTRTPNFVEQGLHRNPDTLVSRLIHVLETQFQSNLGSAEIKTLLGSRRIKLLNRDSLVAEVETDFKRRGRDQFDTGRLLAHGKPFEGNHVERVRCQAAFGEVKGREQFANGLKSANLDVASNTVPQGPCGCRKAICYKSFSGKEFLNSFEAADHIDDRFHATPIHFTVFHLHPFFT